MTRKGTAMRWGTYASPADGGVHPGLLDDGMTFGLTGTGTLAELLGDDGTLLREAARRALDDPFEVVPEFETDLLAPVPAPPSVRLAATTAAVDVRGPFDAVPATVPDLGCRLEVGAIIGRPDGTVAGYTLLGVWSSGAAEFAVTMGPHLVTPDELDGPVRAAITVNDEPRAEGVLDDLGGVFAPIIAAAARAAALAPGTVVGSGELCRAALAPDDEVVLRADALGVLDHRLTAEPA
ncbi:MAG TPA: fumarylacetoacetate hydrolase family protein [Streptosporangiaceae bacterium]|jgi:hypothetical protein